MTPPTLGDVRSLPRPYAGQAPAFTLRDASPPQRRMAFLEQAMVYVGQACKGATVSLEAVAVHVDVSIALDIAILALQHAPGSPQSGTEAASRELDMVTRVGGASWLPECPWSTAALVALNAAQRGLCSHLPPRALRVPCACPLTTKTRPVPAAPPAPDQGIPWPPRGDGALRYVHASVR